MVKEQKKSILYNTLIEKGIIFEQVWQIYNKNRIPITKEEYAKLKANGELEGDCFFDETGEQVWQIGNQLPRTQAEYEKMYGKGNYKGYYEDEVCENLEYNLDYDDSKEGVQQEKYTITLETEASARLRYNAFKDQARKDLRRILKILKSPLIYYENSEKTEPIPVVVAATFAAIADLKKYGLLSPTLMIAVSPDTAGETIEKFLYHSKIRKYEESDYFIMRVIENLKYFFNLTTKANERNFEDTPKFNYKIISDEKHYLIQKRKDADKKSNEDQQEINLDAQAIENEIEIYKEIYLNIVNNQRGEIREIRELLDGIENFRNIFSEQIYRESRDKIDEIIQPLDLHGKDKVRLVVLLDFTEEPFKNTHEILGKKSSNNFYKEWIKIKKDESAYSRAIIEIKDELKNIKRKADQKYKLLINEGLKLYK